MIRRLFFSGDQPEAPQVGNESRSDKGELTHSILVDGKNSKKAWRTEYNGLVREARSIEKELLLEADREVDEVTGRFLAKTGGDDTIGDGEIWKIEQALALYRKAFALYNRDRKLVKKILNLEKQLRDRLAEKRVYKEGKPTAFGYYSFHACRGNNSSSQLNVQTWRTGKSLQLQRSSRFNSSSLSRFGANTAEGDITASEANSEQELCTVCGESTRYFLLPGQFSLSSQVYHRLYPHQREGVRWMYGLFKGLRISTLPDESISTLNQQVAEEVTDVDDRPTGHSEDGHYAQTLHGENVVRLPFRGGILGDDMGLGKTFQIVALLKGLFHHSQIKSVLIVAPVSVLTVWEREIQMWLPEVPLKQFYGGNKSKRERDLQVLMMKGGICLTTYGMITSCSDQLRVRITQKASRKSKLEGHSKCTCRKPTQAGDVKHPKGRHSGDGDGEERDNIEDSGLRGKVDKNKENSDSTNSNTKAFCGDELWRSTRQNLCPAHGSTVSSITKDGVKASKFEWDYLILDEGHKAKNPSTRLSKSIRSLRASNRLILSGTPVQNNLKELWALFDIICKNNMASCSDEDDAEEEEEAERHGSPLRSDEGQNPGENMHSELVSGSYSPRHAASRKPFRLLGSQADFTRDFAEKITRGQENDASAFDHQVAKETTRALWDIIQPYILQRSKSDVLVGPRRMKVGDELMMCVSSGVRSGRPRGEREGERAVGGADTMSQKHTSLKSVDRVNGNGKQADEEAARYMTDLTIGSHSEDDGDVRNEEMKRSRGQLCRAMKGEPVDHTYTEHTIDNTVHDNIHGAREGPVNGEMPRKIEVVVWVTLSAAQIEAYRYFLSQLDVDSMIEESKSPLSAIAHLKKLCSHPRLHKWAGLDSLRRDLCAMATHDRIVSGSQMALDQKRCSEEQQAKDGVDVIYQDGARKQGTGKDCEVRDLESTRLQQPGWLSDSEEEHERSMSSRLQSMRRGRVNESRSRRQVISSSDSDEGQDYDDATEEEDQGHERQQRQKQQKKSSYTSDLCGIEGCQSTSRAPGGEYTPIERILMKESNKLRIAVDLILLLTRSGKFKREEGSGITPTQLHQPGSCSSLEEDQHSECAEQHRVLLFSQSKRMLDIIGFVLGQLRVSFLSLDGSITKLRDREKLIDKFNSDSSISVFLLTTGVGGVGITLTSADRVIIYDPSWNPAQDNQAIDRAYRIGQRKDVFVYRLITCSTVEEKIYGKQIFKGGLIKTISDRRAQQRYFNRRDLRDLFTLVDPTTSALCDKLEAQHGTESLFDKATARDGEFPKIREWPPVYGFSHHDLLYSAELCESQVKQTNKLERVLARKKAKEAAERLTSSHGDSTETIDADGALVSVGANVCEETSSPASSHQRVSAFENVGSEQLENICGDRQKRPRTPWRPRKPEGSQNIQGSAEAVHDSEPSRVLDARARASGDRYLGMISATPPTVNIESEEGGEGEDGDEEQEEEEKEGEEEEEEEQSQQQEREEDEGGEQEEDDEVEEDRGKEPGLADEQGHIEEVGDGLDEYQSDGGGTDSEDDRPSVMFSSRKKKGNLRKRTQIVESSEDEEGDLEDYESEVPPDDDADRLSPTTEGPAERIDLQKSKEHRDEEESGEQDLEYKVDSEEWNDREVDEESLATSPGSSFSDLDRPCFEGDVGATPTQISSKLRWHPLLDDSLSIDLTGKRSDGVECGATSEYKKPSGMSVTRNSGAFPSKLMVGMLVQHKVCALGHFNGALKEHKENSFSRTLSKTGFLVQPTQPSFDSPERTPRDFSAPQVLQTLIGFVVKIDELDLELEDIKTGEVHVIKRSRLHTCYVGPTVSSFPATSSSLGPTIASRSPVGAIYGDVPRHPLGNNIQVYTTTWVAQFLPPNANFKDEHKAACRPSVSQERERCVGRCELGSAENWRRSSFVCAQEALIYEKLIDRAIEEEKERGPSPLVMQYYLEAICLRDSCSDLHRNIVRLAKELRLL